MRKLFTGLMVLGLMLVSLTCSAKSFEFGEMYYITGRQVWLRNEPNTGSEAYRYWRFGEPVVYFGSENGFALVAVPELETDSKMYVYEEFLGTLEEVNAKKRPYSDWVFILDRQLDRLIILQQEIELEGYVPEYLDKFIMEEKNRILEDRKIMANANIPANVLADLNDVSLVLEDMVNLLIAWDNDFSGEVWSDVAYHKLFPAYDKLEQLYR